jgi:exopolysaccharide biosynthesis polyprenyl glycosylphosphotransferase
MLIIGIGVKIDSRGPVFFRQHRIGRNGREFMILKFRSMRFEEDNPKGTGWTVENDPRRTRIGRFIRKYSLDELPQLFNVLVGYMSLVGPRPEQPGFVEQFKDHIPQYFQRHKVKSGITGWAQVNGLRGDTSIEERTRYDLYYVENWSLVLDIKIILLTIRSVFRSPGAY